MSEHEHTWYFIRTFVSEGKPKTMQQLDVDTKKVKMWIDVRQEYVLYHCPCGKSKTVEL